MAENSKLDVAPIRWVRNLEVRDTPTFRRCCGSHRNRHGDPRAQLSSQLPLFITRWCTVQALFVVLTRSINRYSCVHMSPECIGPI
jgi:hypothetical protein